jgi:hypothetical protein
VLREIGGNNDLKRIPVGIVTTSNADEDMLTTYKDYTNCYITKLTGFDQFANVVRTTENFWISIVKLPSGDKR